MISPLAYIHPEAKIGENVEIAPFVFIDKNVVIGDNNKIMANANILYGSRIGNGNTIFPGAVIGAIPQDLKFRGEESTAEIGDNNLIRENVTINRGTAAKGRTIVGNNNLLMEGVHVAHDALVGNGCIIGNSTKMAGDMTVYGLRDDVKLIRENANGKQEIIPLDLNKAETILSPYYYLQQNDIIYVTPNKAKARNSDIGTSTSLWFSATSILVSIASLLFNILK